MKRTIETIDLPTYSPGTQRTLKVWRWGTPGARPKVYLQSALHADEWPGLMASHHLAGMLDEAATRGDITGEVVMLPYANPIGLAQVINDHVLGRHSFAGARGNFNRDWPDLSDAVLAHLDGSLGTDAEANIDLMRGALLRCVEGLPDTSESDAHTKALLGLSIDADYVLDLHCDWEATLHLYSHAEHAPITMELARYLHVPVVLVDTGVAGGPFDETNANPWMRVRKALDLDADILPAACYACTVEFRGQADVSDALGEHDARGLFSFLSRRGIIAGDAPPLPDPLCIPNPLDGTDTLIAPMAGLIAWKKALGDHITVGETVAEIIDITVDDLATARVPVVARATGMLFSVHVDRLVRPGDSFGKIAGDEPLAHRQGESLLSN